MFDQHLPDGKGTELCHSLREFDPHTPVLYYSAVVGAQHREDALDECGDEYLEKPFCITDFKETLLRLLFENELRRNGSSSEKA